jgi:hypothetical protein
VAKLEANYPIPKPGIYAKINKLAAPLLELIIRKNGKAESYFESVNSHELMRTEMRINFDS